MAKISPGRETTSPAAHNDDQPVFDTVAAADHQSLGGIAHDTGDLHRLLVSSIDEYAIFALDSDGYILSWNAGRSV